MDIREYHATGGKNKNRHPWELSRAECLVDEIVPFIEQLDSDGEPLHFMDIGPGDMYIDRLHLRSFPKHVLHAVDIGYRKVGRHKENVFLYRDIDDIRRNDIDYAFMMDCLELIPDDLLYARKLSSKIKPGGYMIFTIPAFNFMYSDHDRFVKNLRRYSHKEFDELIDKAGGLCVVRKHYFYSSLMLVRLIQKVLRLKIDPKHKVTTGWAYSRNHFFTRLCETALSFDYLLHRKLADIGILLPGLSLLVICRKT